MLLFQRIVKKLQSRKLGFKCCDKKVFDFYVQLSTNSFYWNLEPQKW